MSPVPNDPLAGIHMSGKPYLAPDAVVAVARNVTEMEMAPMKEQLQYLVRGFQRLFGDSDDSDIPAEFRSKGILLEMKDDQSAFFEEQRAWKLAQDETNRTASQERVDLRINQERMVSRLEALEKHRSRTQRLWVFLVSWITKKDDGVSVAIGKLVVLCAGIGTLSVTGYHILTFVFHKLLILLERLK